MPKLDALLSWVGKALIYCPRKSDNFVDAIVPKSPSPSPSYGTKKTRRNVLQQFFLPSYTICWLPDECNNNKQCSMSFVWENQPQEKEEKGKFKVKDNQMLRKNSEWCAIEKSLVNRQLCCRFLFFIDSTKPAASVAELGKRKTRGRRRRTGCFSLPSLSAFDSIQVRVTNGTSSIHFGSTLESSNEQINYFFYENFISRCLKKKKKKKRACKVQENLKGIKESVCGVAVAQI